MKSDELGSYLEYKHLFMYLNAEHIKKIPLLKYQGSLHYTTDCFIPVSEKFYSEVLQVLKADEILQL